MFKKFLVIMVISLVSSAANAQRGRGWFEYDYNRRTWQYETPYFGRPGYYNNWARGYNRYQFGEPPPITYEERFRGMRRIGPLIDCWREPWLCQ